MRKHEMENVNSETERAYQREKMNKLALALAFDAVGMLTFLIPVGGELFDLAWAPIAAVANFILFRGVTGAVGGVGTFVEELLPFTDWLPSFTLTWGFKYVAQENRTIAKFVRRRRERGVLFGG